MHAVTIILIAFICTFFGIVIGTSLVGVTKRCKPQQPQPAPSMVDSKPRLEAWVAYMQYGTRVWTPKKLTPNDHDHYVAQAWFAGTLHETEAECKIDCAQRNLDDAERLMKAATGV